MKNSIAVLWKVISGDFLLKVFCIKWCHWKYDSVIILEFFIPHVAMYVWIERNKGSGIKVSNKCLRNGYAVLMWSKASFLFFKAYTFSTKENWPYRKSNSLLSHSDKLKEKNYMQRLWIHNFISGILLLKRNIAWVISKRFRYSSHFFSSFLLFCNKV